MRRMRLQHSLWIFSWKVTPSCLSICIVRYHLGWNTGNMLTMKLPGRTTIYYPLNCHIATLRHRPSLVLIHRQYPAKLFYLFERPLHSITFFGDNIDTIIITVHPPQICKGIYFSSWRSGESELEAYPLNWSALSPHSHLYLISLCLYNKDHLNRYPSDKNNFVNKIPMQR